MKLFALLCVALLCGCSYYRPLTGGMVRQYETGGRTELGAADAAAAAYGWKYYIARTLEWAGDVGLFAGATYGGAQLMDSGASPTTINNFYGPTANGDNNSVGNSDSHNLTTTTTSCGTPAAK